MRRTLYLKFILAYIIFGCFGFAMVATVVSRITEEHVIREVSEAHYHDAIMIAESYAADLYGARTSLDAVKKELDTLAPMLDGTIWIINPSGRLVLDSSREIPRDSEFIVDGFDPALPAGFCYTIGNFFDSFGEDMLSVLAPITGDYKVVGYVVIHTPISYIRAQSNSLLIISYITFGILFILSLIILIFFTEIVYVPLKKITAATEQYAEGNMHYTFTVESGDEMGYLAASLNYMASEIARAEDNQKKFVANVSHDFRSPLTSIQGYLNAMLDGTIPPEMYEKYLHIVLNETDRLRGLTNSLLTLNNLNMKGMILELTVFDINQVIRDTAASFEGTCMGKDIRISLELTGEEMPVKADKGKIQQVLYNLLDNAIKFSPKNSVITIETMERKHKVFISVKDCGIGIPKEDLKLIWDRFYKSDLSRGKDKKGTGLGLSITKEIIQAHNEHINVISTVGAGTEFTFSLPVVGEAEL